MTTDGLNRLIYEALCGAPASTTTASTGAEQQPTQIETFANWVVACAALPEVPPGRNILVAPNDHLARSLCEEVDSLTAFMKGLGINILVNEHLPKRVAPVRQHKLRHGHTAYHKRIQKKWTKRFGTKDVECWYVTNAQHLLEPLR